MLQKQNIVLSLAGGIDSKTDEKQVMFGKLLVLENGIFTSPKEIRKRNGYAAFSSLIQNNNAFTSFSTVSTNLVSGNSLNSFLNEIVLNDNYNLHSFSTGINEWVYKGKNTICDVSSTPVIRNTFSQTFPDSAINPAGIQIFSWTDSSDSNAHIAITDTSTKQILISNKVLSPTGGGNTLLAKCAYISGRLVVFWLDSTTNMKMYFMTYSNGIFSSPTVLFTDVNTDITKNNYDLYLFNNRLYIAYNTNTPSIKITFLDTTLTQGTTITKTSTDASGCICVTSDLAGNIWIGYSDRTSIKAFVVNAIVTVTISAPTTIDTYNASNITATGLTSNVMFLYCLLGTADANGNFSNSTITYNTATVAGSTITAGTPSVYLNSAYLKSKAFSLNSPTNILIPYVVVSHDGALQPTYFVTNLYNVTSSSIPQANVIGKIAPSVAGGPAGRQGLASVNLTSTNTFQTSLLQKDLLYTAVSSTGTVNTFSQTGVISATIDFTQTNLQNLTLGQNLHIGSGMLGMYDGNSVVEHNFHLFPEAVTIVVNTSGGNLTDSSTYGYQITYEWTDNQGQLHRSAPSPIVSITTGSHSNASQAVLTIPTLRITGKTNVNIVIYRTQANGTIYYRLNQPNAPLANTTTSNTVTYTDNASDTSIAANQQLYTTGGEVENNAAPASTILATYKNRIILIPSENPYSWWFSKQVIPGSPVEFSEFFVENISTNDGPILAVSQMDSNLIFFKENTIWYVQGDGPSPSGANNDFTDALQLATDVGCINSQSIVLTPVGLVFKSNKGIYLLSRGLGVQYIGADVEAYNQYNVTSALLIIDTNQVRFTLSNGTVLVVDYYVQQWSVFTNIASLSSIINLNNFTYLQSNGLVLQETPGVFNDNGSFIKLKLMTSWLSLAGLEGFQRFYKMIILGQYLGPHKLKINFAYDFNPVFTQDDLVDVSTILNTNLYGGAVAGSNGALTSGSPYGREPLYGGQYPSYQWRIFPKQQLCTSVQIALEDVPVVGTVINEQGIPVQVSYNEGLSLSSMTLEIGSKRGQNKISARNSS